MNRNGSIKNALVISACLHAALLLLLYFGLPSFFEPLPLVTPPVPLTIIEIADITNTRLKDMKPEENQPPAKPPEPKPPEPKPPTPQPAPTPPKPQPQPKQPEPAPKPPEPETVPDELAPPKPKPVEIPKKVEPPKPKPDDLASVLKNVAKLKPTETSKTVEKPKETPQKDSPAKTAQNNAPALSDKLTISQQDALRRQLEQFWNPPIGAPNPESLVVEVLIEMNPDRTVRNATVVDTARFSGDRFYRAAADAALRAVFHYRNVPLDTLPLDKFDTWQTIRSTFDPRDAL